MSAITADIFRAYDIRGVVETELTEPAVELIGQAIGSEARDQKETTVIVGRDGRLSGPALSRALIQGLLKTGCHVIDIGMIPTPLLYFATHVLASRSGVMITGSHNPPEYNGIKIVIQGKTFAEPEIQSLYHRIQNDRWSISEKPGTLTEVDVVDRYIDRIAFDVKLAKPLHIVVDCGNGIGGKVAAKLYRRLGCRVTELFCEVDGTFPHHHPDPSVLKNLTDIIETVQTEKADVGLALDGDADRLWIVTNEGKVIYPDRLLMLFASDVLARNRGGQVIYDVKCTRFLQDEISKRGGVPLMWKTGHSFLKEKMQETGALLGGEMSGHFVFKERWYGFDDGLYSGARLLEILSQQDLSSDEVFRSFPEGLSTPELKLPMDDSKKFIFIKAVQDQATFPDGTVNTIDGVRVDFKDGWGLIRVSNTTPNLTLRFEADDDASLKRIQELFRQELLKVDPTLKLPF